MFHFPRCRPPRLFDSARGRRDRPAGLPHSETHGSRAACASPWNIAACRVLRRHPLPRHPSCARKAWPQNLFARPRLRTSDAPAGSPRRAGAGSPFCILLPSKSISIFRFRLSKSFPQGGAPREPSGAIQAEHRPRLRQPARRPLQKEVIQPLVPQRLPCYDFIPVTGPTFVDCPPRGSARRLRVWSAPMM